MPLLFHSGQLIRFAVGCKIVLLHGSSGIFNSNFNNMRVASCMLRKTLGWIRNSRSDEKKKKKSSSCHCSIYLALLTFHFVQLIDCSIVHSNVPRPQIVVSFSLPTFFTLTLPLFHVLGPYYIAPSNSLLKPVADRWRHSDFLYLP